MTTDEAALLTWMDLRGDPVSDTALETQFPRFDPGILTIYLNSLLQHGQIERDRRYYRLTSAGRRALIEMVARGYRKPFEGRTAI